MTNNDVEIKMVKAVDVTKLPTIKNANRQIVLMEGDVPTVDGLLISAGGKSIFVVKDLMLNNLRGPDRRPTYRGW